MQMKTLKSKAITILVLLAVIAGLLPAAAFAAAENSDAGGNTVYISNEREFAAFADSCRLDSWSVGKNIILTGDIRLSSPIDPIPSFSGSFYGNGHTVSNLKIKGMHTRAGLFGILDSSALVMDLNVSGTLKPSGTVEYLGGVAAVNLGRIVNCSFNGRLKGDKEVGGIAGYNYGIINKCSTDCVIRGEKEVGGIAGRNDGSVLNSGSSSKINSRAGEGKFRLNELKEALGDADIREKVRILLTVKQFAAPEDVGGIAGYSCGVIDSCRNSGLVGREGTGFNVGGIAGRNCGYIAGSANSGEILGEQYVGGIAGLAEPSIAAIRDGDLVDPIRTEVNKFLELVTDFTYDLDNCADDLTGEISELAESIAEISDNLAVFELETSKLVNSKIHEVNDIKGLAADAMQDVADVTDNINNLSGRISVIVSYSTDLVNISNQMIPEVSGGQLTGGYVNVDDDPVSCQYWADYLGIEPYTGEEDDRDRFLNDLDAGFVVQISGEVNNLAGDIKGIADGVHNAVDSIAGIGDLGDFALIQNSFNQGFADLMSSIRKTMEKVDGLSGSIDNLLKVMTDTVRTLAGEVNYIANGVFDAVYDFSEGGFTLRRFYYSTDEYKTTVVTGNGVISACENSGTVKAISEAGGIAGAQQVIGIPDIISKNSKGLAIVSFCFTDLIQHCKNTGNIVSQDDYAGLITGCEDLGAIFDCEGYGTVQSRNGRYAGGIAGLSRGDIVQCYVKAAILADDYAGGIAGSGEDTGSVSGSSISDCVAQIEIYSGGQFVGGISGTDEGDFSGNVFINENLNGVDDFSLSGKAEPGELSKLKLPDGFSTHEISSKGAVKRAAGQAPVTANVKLILIIILIALLIILSVTLKHAAYYRARKIWKEMSPEQKKEKADNQKPPLFSRLPDKMRIRTKHDAESDTDKE